MNQSLLQQVVLTYFVDSSCRTWSDAINKVVKTVKCTTILTIAGILISFNITLSTTVYRNNWLTLKSNCLFAIQSELSIGMKSPMKKLLVSIKQSNSGNFVYFWFPPGKFPPNSYLSNSSRKTITHKTST